MGLILLCLFDCCQCHFISTFCHLLGKYVHFALLLGSFFCVTLYDFSFITFQENGKAKFLFICMSGFILLSVVLGVLISQTEISLSMNWMLPKLSGENAFALMSLLGANIMPHNFFLHSSIVQVSLPSIPAVTYP